MKVPEEQWKIVRDQLKKLYKLTKKVSTNLPGPKFRAIKHKKVALCHDADARKKANN